MIQVFCIQAAGDALPWVAIQIWNIALANHKPPSISRALQNILEAASRTVRVFSGKKIDIFDIQNFISQESTNGKITLNI